MIQTLSTAMSAFRTGESYEVVDATGAAWIKAGLAVETDLPPEWISDLYARLDVGAGKPCLLLPHLGEFGHRICTGIRICHWHKCDRTTSVVAIREGEQVLYPSYRHFITNWTDPTDDSRRAGTMRSPASMWPDITSRFPDHVAIEQGGLTPTQELIAICPDQRIPFRPKRRGLTAEVLIGVRRRQFHDTKNFPHWQRIADALRAEGITFATIGDRSSSFDLDGQEWHSRDFDTDAAIEGMQSCRLFLSTDTGSAHLAATVGCRQLVIREEFFGRNFVPRMKQVNPN
ncbi:MAG TPA: hypothetical protein VG326_12185, partial [Tepidisphaeraceae bacterium]|nr:hypothetical protein [Tepidisphaeraceae bacterium]